MKIAVSIPDDVFSVAESFATRRKMNRSSLYAQAIRDFLARNSGEDVTARLDEVYGAQPSKLDPGLKKAQHAVLRRSEW